MLHRALRLASLGLLVAPGVLSCRGPSPAERPLAIRPSVAVAPASVPAGGPVSLLYRWTIGAGKLPTVDHRAFVHFLDAEGSVLFTDDHQPEPAVSGWQAGRTYEYRRSTLTRAFPYAGRIRVVLGLFDVASGARLPLQGVDAGQRSYHVADLVLAPRDEDLPLTCTGFYPPEAPPTAPLLVSRFMAREARCRFPNPREEVAVFVHADLEPSGFPKTPTLSLATRADACHSFPLTLTSEPQLIRLRLPARALGRAAQAELRLRSSDVYTPAALLRDADPRELSVRILGLYAARTSRLAAELLEGVPALTRSSTSRGGAAERVDPACER